MSKFESGGILPKKLSTQIVSEEVILPVREKNENEVQYEFSPEDLRQFFTSKKFLEALGVAARFTEDSGYESAFTVYLGEDKKDVILPEVLRGNTDSVSTQGYSRTTLKVFDGNEALLKKRTNFEFAGILFDYHFHPDTDSTIVPSAADLKSYQASGTGLAGIGQVRSNGEVDILLAKRKFSVTHDEVDVYENEANPEHTQREVDKLLEELGFTVGKIHLKKNKGKYELSENALQVLEKIGTVKVQLSSKVLEYFFE